MKELLFTKMHGIGNDYIYINCLSSIPDHISRLAVEMSRQHTGVGADGIILILPSDNADFGMRIFNADGSEAKMCGNGARCVGKYLWDYNLTDSTHITLETLSGIKHLYLHPDAQGSVNTVTVDMGAPSTLCKNIGVTHNCEEMIEFPISIDDSIYRITAVSMGNPHGVIFTDSLSDIDIADLGSKLEHHPMWHDRANIEFIETIDSSHINMRVWERGSGETMACGTGACAAAVAARITGRCQAESITVSLLGGDLQISFADNGNVMLTGPAATVMEGRYFTQDINPTESTQSQC
ncbi:MAG: diaminopimelate epimerase [Paramuribaculum sp.]|nr:diaminopimelate epimerase [Paramuribaculum sp.]